MGIVIRPVDPVADSDAVWAMLQPVLHAGETYALPRDWGRQQALGYWMSEEKSVFVAEADGDVVGVYYLKANQRGGGAHVSNCGYVTAAAAQGRGVARAMAEHSFVQARRQGFSAMQYNFVISSNTRAIALWERLGFAVVGRLPRAYDHPVLGPVDALVMHRFL